MEENIKIPKEQFLSEVKHEIEQLKIHASNREKNNLDFRAFDPVVPTQCIYGQMTGACYSKRAKELMDLSCIRLMNIRLGYLTDKFDGYEDEKFLTNGKYQSNLTWRDEELDSWGRYSRKFEHLSALEGYILLSDAKNRQIISYIKGEIESLEL